MLISSCACLLRKEDPSEKPAATLSGSFEGGQGLGWWGAAATSASLGSPGTGPSQVSRVIKASPGDSRCGDFDHLQQRAEGSR